jgi:D-glycero-alpha-D-manno-heptose 1-phosphate guanylyltransferase
MLSTAEAIILAGGLGARLRPVVSDVPKPLAPVAGRPFLAYLLDALARAGFRKVVLATGYRGEMIEAAVGGRHRSLEIRYSREDRALGTGGAIWQALAMCEGEHVVVVNGDTLLDLDYPAFVENGPAGDVIVAVRMVEDRLRYGSVVLDGGRIIRFLEKGAAGPGLVNSGVYLLRRSLAREIPKEPPFSFEHEILEGHIADLSILAFVTNGEFIDIGTPEDFGRSQQILASWPVRAGA